MTEERVHLAPGERLMDRRLDAVVDSEGCCSVCGIMLDEDNGGWDMDEHVCPPGFRVVKCPAADSRHDQLAWARMAAKRGLALDGQDARVLEAELKACEISLLVTKGQLAVCQLDRDELQARLDKLTERKVRWI